MVLIAMAFQKSLHEERLGGSRRPGLPSFLSSSALGWCPVAFFPSLPHLRVVAILKSEGCEWGAMGGGWASGNSDGPHH